MKIGITQPTIAPDMVGLSNVFALLKKALAQRHMVLELPPGYDRHSKSQRRLSAEQFVLECDAILGVGKLEVLEARESLGKPVPYLFYALGHFSRGAIGIAGMLPYVTNLDTIIVNCTADEAIAQQLLQNAQVEVIPYPVDLEFYRDLGETNRERARESFGIASATPILLYPGRITLEKNVHTLIKIFGEVQRRVPTALLLLAGRIYDRPVPELGLYVINLERAISRTIERSGIPEGHVRFLGHAEASTMRDLYNIADVVVNTTLHHDENFGNAQVEALACGTPVVGTYWGGLKDSIVDDTTGYHISTYVTPIGIKVNWLEAIDNVVSILQDDRLRSRLRQSSLERAAEKYSMCEFVRRVDAAMNRTLRVASMPRKPLSLSRFGAKIWEECVPGRLDEPMFQRGPKSFLLYQELIRPYAGITGRSVATDSPLMDEHIVILAVPTSVSGNSRLTVNDVLYPFEVEIPAAYEAAVLAVLREMQEHPAVVLGTLLECHVGMPTIRESLVWMLRTGLLLRMRGDLATLETTDIGWKVNIATLIAHKISSNNEVIAFDSYDSWVFGRDGRPDHRKSNVEQASGIHP